MDLRYITCSDPREHNRISEIIKLGKMPNAEIAVQCHPSKMADGLPRNVWFKRLLKQTYGMSNINLAVHVNNEWADEICTRGTIPNELVDWMTARNMNGTVTIKRVQINMPEYTVQNIKPDLVAKIINDFFKHEFIFQYNDKTKPAIEKLHNTGAKFSLLFDASGGRGVIATNWQKPIYETHPMGYSGGISPDNVIDRLRKIDSLVDSDTPIWIDAEGRLKSNDLFDEKYKFDVELARMYIERANKWINGR